jgi:methanogenic corrinoid protein MtbC1
MSVHYLGDNGPDGMAVGTSSTEKVGFHGTAPTAQQVLTTLATGATITTVVTSVQEIIEELQNKGLMGAN